jgi:1,4-dihydroxy-2-naphthoate octaprenyltransferase
METPKFLTVKTGDARLADLLDGRSDDLSVRPLLVSTLNPESLKASDWTFEFVSLDSLNRPSLIYVWIRALRPETLVLSVAPMLAISSLLVREGVFDARITVQALIGVLALHAAIGLFNDYHDHVKGWDRISEHGGARVISRGWLRARDVKHGAWTAFGIALLAGVPLAFTRFSIGIVIGLLALLATLEFAISKFSLKYKGFHEVAAWFMFGPQLTAGFYWAVAGRFEWTALLYGTLFGSFALLILHLKNFERILIDGRAGFRTWPVRAGFDASKRFAYFCLLLVLSASVLISITVDPIPERTLIPAVLILASQSLFTRIRNLESPVAGQMRGLAREGYFLAWWGFLAFILGEIVRTFETWYPVIANLGSR